VWNCELLSAAAVVEAAVRDAAVDKDAKAKAAKSATDAGEGEESNPHEEEEEEEEEEIVGEEIEEQEDWGGEEGGSPYDSVKPLKRAVEPASEASHAAHGALLRGETVPTAVVMALLRERMASTTVGFRGYVLDGFPSLVRASHSPPSSLALLPFPPVLPSSPPFPHTHKTNTHACMKHRHTQGPQPSFAHLERRPGPPCRPLPITLSATYAP